MEQKQYPEIPREKFAFANTGERLTDHKFVDKPIGYFKDAWIRFCRNKASIVAAIIILLIILFSIVTPLFNTRYDSTFMDVYYQKMGPRNLALSKIGIATGTVDRKYTAKGLIGAYAIGLGALDWDGSGVSLAESAKSEYQPVKANKGLDGDVNNQLTRYDAKLETYLGVGFLYMSIEQSEYQKIVEWENATGKHVLYPLIETNEYNPDPTSTSANYWYKTDSKYNPVRVGADGKAVRIKLPDVITDESDIRLEDNYKRNGDGTPKYYEYTGGGTAETAMYRVRVLYYNYYQYKNGFAPEYLFGTDSQGYDLALRLADGVRLSLMVAMAVSIINFIIGAVYGAIQGYYGGTVDLVLDRICDILSGVPFIVVATLFQIHLAKKVGAIPSLLFAFVLTGWIGTAYRVRTQFYRFKNQEYVMAAHTLGASDARIILKHIFPNSLGTIITSSVLVIPGVIFSESMLSFLGIVKLGGSGTTSLGTLLSDASSIWTNYPHLMLFPALIISLLEISFNLFGNGLRDAFNPSLRGVEG